MAVRALGVVIEEDAVVDTPDAYKVSDWAAGAVAFTVERGMINLDEDGNVNPDIGALRSEAAMTLSKLLEYMETVEGS